jgi:hypothetical protein
VVKIREEQTEGENKVQRTMSGPERDAATENCTMRGSIIYTLHKILLG